MFNILKDLFSKERTVTVKLIATMLIMTLTFANVILLVTYMGRGLISYATDSDLKNQDSSTNVSNVEFDVYFDYTEKRMNTVKEDINSENLTLYAQVRVIGGGVLNEAELSFGDTNFRIEQGTNLKFNTIASGQGATIEIPIKFSREGDSLNLGFLTMVSSLKLTGKYTNNKGKIEDIDTTKGVKVIWDASGVSEEDNLAYIKSEVITNKVLRVGEENKRIMQVLVMSGIKDNKYPIKETNIHIDAPKINDGILPEEIKVATYRDCQWSYDEQDSNIDIKIENIPDNNNNVVWNKSGQDEFIVTYVYAEDIDLSGIELDTKNTVLLYDENNTILESENKTNKVNEDVVNVVTFESNITNQVYKSKLNIGNDIEYATKWFVGISYSPAIEKVYINDIENILYSGEEAQDYANTVYKSSIIDKEEFLNLFGEEGQLKIYSGDVSEETLICVINNEAETDENGNLVINYEDNINSLIMVSSKPITEGKLNVLHNKVLKVQDMSFEQISEITNLKYKSLAYGTMNGEENDIIVKEKDMKFEAPVSFARLGMDKTTLSTANVNNVSFTVTLKTDDLKYDLYTNPVFEIEIPSYVKELNVKNVQVLNNNGLELKVGNVTTNSKGNKVIHLELQGSQTSYGENTQIVIDTEMITEKLMPTITDVIKLSFQNAKDTTYLNEEPINVIFESEKGWLLSNSVVNGKTEIQSFRKDTKVGKLDIGKEEREVTYKGTVINNTNEEQSNVRILGRIPFKGNKSIKDGEELGTTINATLASVIKVASKNSKNIDAKVYYSPNENATEDLQDSNNGWTEKVTIESKSYLIVVETLETKDVLEFTYDAQIPANLGVNQSIYATYAVDSGMGMIEATKVGLETEKQLTLDLNVKSSITENGMVYKGQEVLYTIEVTNTSEVIANNVQINNPVPEGTTLLDENADTLWTINSLGMGETVQRTVTVMVDDTEANENGIIINETMVNADFLPQQLTNTLALNVEETELKVTINSYVVPDEDNVITEPAEMGGYIYYTITITNDSTRLLNNVKLTSLLPSQLEYVDARLLKYLGINEGREDFTTVKEADINYDKDSNEVICNIEKINPQERYIVYIEGKVIDYAKNIINNVIVECDEELGEGNKIELVESTRMLSPIKLVTGFISVPIGGATIKPGDNVEYVLTLKNEGETPAKIKIVDDLPKELMVISGKYKLNDEDYQEVYTGSEGLTLSNIIINENDILELRIVTKVLELETGVKSKEISNSIVITGDYMDDVNTNSISHLVKIDETNPTDPTDPTNPTDPTEPTNPTDPTDPTNPTDPDTKTYKITGTAWLDVNKDGKKDEEEELLKGIAVKVKESGQYLKDENDKDIEVITDENGNYEIPNLVNGKSYVVVFIFDIHKYSVTEYKAQGVIEMLNSKAKLVTEGEDSIAQTDSLKIEEKDLSNINIGLIETPIFDLRLDKYISKMTVKNQDGTTVYEYDSELGKTVKIDVRAKYVQGTVVVIEYTIAVTNDGEISGYAKSIVDYMSPDLTFSSELNSNWYQEKDSLYCLELANDEIKPGETKEVKLILTKIMTSNNTGLTSNSAEIYEDYNEYSIPDINSIPGNKEVKENDYSSAEVIITIRTGGPVMYISIVIVCMAILGRRDIYY